MRNPVWMAPLLLLLTVKAAAIFSNRSPSSVPRVIYPILEDNRHPDRHHIVPDVATAKPLRLTHLVTNLGTWASPLFPVAHPYPSTNPAIQFEELVKRLGQTEVTYPGFLSTVRYLPAVAFFSYLFDRRVGMLSSLSFSYRIRTPH